MDVPRAPTAGGETSFRVVAERWSDAGVEAWIEDHRPRPGSEWIGSGGVGLVIDAVRPLRIE